MRHVERLQGDIELVASIADLFAGNDSLAMIHSDIVASMKANLVKAKQSEDRFCSFELINEWVRRFANEQGVPFTDFQPPHDAADRIAQIEDELRHLRAMLARQVVIGDADKENVPNLKNLRRLVNTIIRQEKNLFAACVEGDVYMTEDVTMKLARKATNAIIESARRGLSDEEWALKVDDYLASVGYILTPPKRGP